MENKEMFLTVKIKTESDDSGRVKVHFEGDAIDFPIELSGAMDEDAFLRFIILTAAAGYFSIKESDLNKLLSEFISNKAVEAWGEAVKKEKEKENNTFPIFAFVTGEKDIN